MERGRGMSTAEAGSQRKSMQRTAAQQATTHNNASCTDTHTHTHMQLQVTSLNRRFAASHTRSLRCVFLVLFNTCVFPFLVLFLTRTCALPSSDAVSSSVPAGEMATRRTGAVWPRSTSRCSAPAWWCVCACVRACVFVIACQGHALQRARSTVISQQTQLDQNGQASRVPCLRRPLHHHQTHAVPTTPTHHISCTHTNGATPPPPHLCKAGGARQQVTCAAAASGDDGLGRALSHLELIPVLCVRLRLWRV